MMIGPEPIRRIFFRSVRLGIVSVAHQSRRARPAQTPHSLRRPPAATKTTWAFAPPGASGSIFAPNPLRSPPMSRRLIPLVVLFVVVLGCSRKKAEDPAPSGGGGGGTPEPAASGQTYTITIRPQKAGDELAVVESLKGTTTMT